MLCAKTDSYFFEVSLLNFFSYHHIYSVDDDGYHLYQNGTKLIPSGDYFSIVFPSRRDLRFKHHAYFLLDSTKF